MAGCNVACCNPCPPRHPSTSSAPCQILRKQETDPNITRNQSHAAAPRNSPYPTPQLKKKKQASLLFCHALGQRTTSSSGFLVLHSLFFSHPRILCVRCYRWYRTDGRIGRTDGRQADERLAQEVLFSGGGSTGRLVLALVLGTKNMLLSPRQG